MTSFMVFASDVTIKVGGNVWTIGLDLIIYLVVAAVLGLIAEYIVGWRVPFGIIGAIVAALVGMWLLTKVIVIGGIGDYYIQNIPVFRALIGAILFVGLWHLITYGFYRRRYHTRHHTPITE
ncbi:putative membrane protein YeaQ/YmgE (transglycosylase-associated protein family) [Thermosporothrix hazakensis]|uniref:GlsB/YeaQ/YmgE family stress response membrane protein n=3 Tax=Thermosporothrix TaxID=768650 RepID=A0A455ST41_9CHLR|nr:GlsB/YeaQ/YmgE family stress response membrane protein [Thermosporothrix hazakensis]PZW32889.1 putative membrane protein YeaQ/YmgE (transglycosylase-associated protein family) [Thermosporothrix hazakensis]BBH90870.1 hypothetical protein KTC_56210 [Thermosporothrix sp. COM3]GCE48921.1 hypothetical protein KTH_37900 [Thermosporothrix hazakensis]